MTLAICVALTALTWTVFGQTLGHGFVNYDDPNYVYQNPVVMAGLTRSGILWALTFAGIGHWHPVTWLSHMLDWQLFGPSAGGHHLTSLIFHAATAILLFLALKRMTGALWRSAIVAAVFAIHPQRVESVAWIAERKDVLSGFFFMATILAYVRYTREVQSAARYALVVILFALGLMSKGMLVTLPFVLLLLDYWPLRRLTPEMLGSMARPESRAKAWRLIAEKIPLLILSAASCVMTNLSPEKIPPAQQMSFLPRAANALVSYVIYLMQMLYPARLTVPYLNPSGGLPPWQVIGSLVLLIAVSVVALLFWRRHPSLLVGWLWYLGMMAPVIGLVQISYYARADRYTYLPQIGIVLAITWVVADATAGNRKLRRVMAVTAVAVTVAFACCAWNQTRYWRNSETLWLHSLAVTTNNSVAHNNLGEAWLASGRLDDAIREAQLALSISPDSVTAHGNLGRAFLKKGNSSAAIQEFRRVLSLEPGNIKATLNLAAAFLQSRRVAEAVMEYQKALAITPNSAEVHLDLGDAYLRAGRLAEAIAQFKLALELQPRSAEAGNSLAAAFAGRQQWAEAIHYWRETLKINPDSVAAQTGLAWTLATAPDATVRNGAEALAISEHLSKTATASNPMLLRVLAAAYAELRRFNEANAAAERGIALATSQNEAEMAALLQADIKLYQSAQPLRDSGTAPNTR